MSYRPTRPIATAVATVAVAGATATAALFGAGSAQAAPSATDTTFITANEQSNLAEIALGQLVLQRSSNSAARDLATMTIADHQTAMTQLTSVAQALGVTLPTQPNATQQAQAQTLQSASADSFDLTYGQIQVLGHQTSIADTNTELSGGSDASVKTYATGYLPVAQKHLQMADDLVTQLGGTPGSVPAGTGGQAATTSGTTQAVEITALAVGGVLLTGAGAAGVVGARRRRVTGGSTAA